MSFNLLLFALVTVESCTNSELKLHLMNASEEGLVFIQGRGSACKHTTTNTPQQLTFDFGVCDIQYVSLLSLFIDKTQNICSGYLVWTYLFQNLIGPFLNIVTSSWYVSYYQQSLNDTSKITSGHFHNPCIFIKLIIPSVCIYQQMGRIKA